MIASHRLPELSLREKAAQMVFLGLPFAEPDYDTVKRLARTGAGGLVIFGGDRFDVAPALNSLQRLSQVPMLVSADYEDGVGGQVRGATALPTSMAVGATGSEELAELKGRVTAREARAIGVQWVLAPVVDLQSNPKNPIINVRSFGEDPALVTRLSRAFLKGLHAGGAIGCLKHFPGHGDVDQDSHLVLPRVARDARSLRARELRPFADLIPDTDAVMTAHLLVEAFDRERPASLSRAVTTDLLRGEMKFGGLVCTDALMMGAIRSVAGPEEAALAAIEAGADVLLIPDRPDETIDAIAAAAQSGRIPERALDRAVMRIWAAKQRAGLQGDARVKVEEAETLIGCEAHRTAARRIAEAAITLAFDRAGLLPLKGPVRYSGMRDESARGDLTQFEKALAARGRLSESAPVGVLAIFSKQQSFSGRSGPDPRRVEEARAAMGPVEKLVVVSFGNPYMIDLAPDAAAYVCAYGECEALQVAAARAIAGEIPFRGKLPVKLG